MSRALVPIPDRDFDLTEVAVPGACSRAGHEVVFARKALRGPRAGFDGHATAMPICLRSFA